MDPIDALIDAALQEDIGPGDVTTENLVSPGATGRGEIIAKQDLIAAGLDPAGRVFRRLDPDISFDARFRDGEAVGKGDRIAAVSGNLRALLMGERVSLNFLQRLSGIATHARTFVSALGDANVRLTDTRKTTPGWRVLEKSAVRAGGGANHRMGLFDGALIKDNHIAVCGGVKPAVAKARAAVHHLVKIEVEAATLAEVEDALAAGADVIMLDNMDLAQIRAAVRRINGRALTEVSGGVTAADLGALAETGVDVISSGALTHHAVSVDISMYIKADGPP